MEDPGFTNLDLTVNPDWTFEGSSFAGLTWLIRPALPAGWFLERVTIDGREVTDTPTSLTTDVTNMEIVLTRRATVVHGRVTEGNGAATTIVVFATDAGRWTPYPRFIRRADANATGMFEIRGLPPGSYAAVAVPSLADGDESDPELLRAWLPMATRVDLGNEETKTIEVGLLR
jgi:hypothetical protein